MNLKLPYVVVIIFNQIIIWFCIALLFAPLGFGDNVFVIRYIFIWGFAFDYNVLAEKAVYLRYFAADGYSNVIMVLMIIGFVLATIASLYIDRIFNKKIKIRRRARQPSTSEAERGFEYDELKKRRIIRNVKISFIIQAIGTTITFVSLMLFVIFIKKLRAVNPIYQVRFWTYIILVFLGLGIIYSILGAISKIEFAKPIDTMATPAIEPQ